MLSTAIPRMASIVEHPSHELAVAAFHRDRNQEGETRILNAYSQSKQFVKELTCSGDYHSHTRFAAQTTVDELHGCISGADNNKYH